MHSAATLALLLCAGQVSALPVSSPMTKGDTKVMRCVLEVISDSLSKPSPVPVSLDCLETLQGDERILSILRHQNLLKELQDLAFQGAKERVQQQKQQLQEHSDFEDELSEVLENQNPEAKAEEVTAEAPSKDTVDKREDSEEAQQGGRVTKGARPQAFLESKQDSPMVGNGQAPAEKDIANTQPPASLPSQEHPQAAGHREEGLSTQQGQQASRAKQEEEEEEEGEAEEKAGPEEEGPTAASSSGPSLDYKEIQKGPSETQAVDGGENTVAVAAGPSRGKGEWERSEQEEEEEEEVMAGAPGEVFQGGKSRELQQQQQRKKEKQPEEQEQLSREWEDAKRWGTMDQLAKELTAEKRLEEDPDHSMKLSFRARPYSFREPGPQPRWGWRPPSSREDSVEAGLPLQTRGDPGEKKEEEGSANRRSEDQELESLSAIEAELEKVAHQLRALRRG